MSLALLGWGAVILTLVPVGVVSLMGLVLGGGVLLLGVLALVSAGWCLVRPETMPLHARLARRLGRAHS